MLIRKIIENRKHDFLVYGKAAEKSGFIDQIENMIHECKRYCITSEGMKSQLAELQKSKSSDVTLLHKMHDFSLIYDEFEQQLFEKYVDSEDYLRLLAEKIPSSTYLQQATILIDGFHSFTPQELVVLEKLIEVCKSVKIALTLDKPFTHQPHELHLFHMTGKTYFQFKEIAGRLGIKVEVQTLKSNHVLRKIHHLHILNNTLNPGQP
jgi:ATP-dependent helicase/nuclease subunit B